MSAAMEADLAAMSGQAPSRSSGLSEQPLQGMPEAAIEGCISMFLLMRLPFERNAPDIAQNICIGWQAGLGNAILLRPGTQCFAMLSFDAAGSDCEFLECDTA